MWIASAILYWNVNVKTGKNEWLYFVNYYGQFSNCDLVKLKKKYELFTVV